MKSRIPGLLIFALIISISTAYAQPGKKLTMTGYEVFNPFGIPGLPIPQIGVFISFGTVACPGHQPTGDPAMPCPAGSRTHLRDAIFKSRFVSTTPGISDGWFTIVANSNLDADFTGPQFGTFVLEYDQGGVMEGNWSGVRYKEGSVWIAPLHATGKIKGGPFDGGNAVISDVLVQYTPIVVAYTGTIEASVRLPK